MKLPFLSQSPASAKVDELIDRVVQLYGDLIYDMCESILRDSSQAQQVFRSVLKEVRQSSADRYSHHERAWILRLTCSRLRKVHRPGESRLTPSEQIQLDSTPGIELRMHQFGAYFQRLNIDDRLLLLLKDKFGIPYPEIAAALAAPEESLKVQRHQALRTLEEWIWEQA